MCVFLCMYMHMCEYIKYIVTFIFICIFFIYRLEKKEQSQQVFIKYLLCAVLHFQFSNDFSTLNYYKGIKHSFYTLKKLLCIIIWINICAWYIQVLVWSLWTVLNLTSKHLKNNLKLLYCFINEEFILVTIFRILARKWLDLL